MTSPSTFYRILGSLVLVIYISYLSGQEDHSRKPKNWSLSTQLHSGYNNTPNTGFPKLDPQLGLSILVTRDHHNSKALWAQRLKDPRTGICIGLTDLGNREFVGRAISILPWLEVPLGNSTSFRNWSLAVGYGGSYIDRQHDPLQNPDNQAISTALNWTYRTFVQYSPMHSTRFLNWKLGLGYIHHSNGHTRLPNQGLNSFVLSLAGVLNHRTMHPVVTPIDQNADGNRERWLNLRLGRGMNVLSLDDNQTLPVHSIAMSYSTFLWNILRVGPAMYLRKYEHYERFMRSEHPLMQEEYEELGENPALNSMAMGLGVEMEMLMNNVGAEMDIGLNVFKPAYPLDWKVNEGRIVDGVYEYGELNWYYQVKRTISSRLALNYHFFSKESAKPIDIYLSVALNANLGQADFTEVSAGVLYSLAGE